LISHKVLSGHRPVPRETDNYVASSKLVFALHEDAQTMNRAENRKREEAKLWDEWAQGLRPKLATPYTDDEYDKIMSWMEIEKTKRGLFLEVGSGTSPYGIRLAKAGHNVVAVDISKAELAEAHGYARSQNVEMQFVRADIEHLPLRSESVNTVVCGTVLHHVHYVLKDTLAEFVRVLEKGGKMVAFEPNSHDLLEYLFYHPRNPLHFKSPNERPLCPRNLRRMLNSVGFSSSMVEPKVFYSDGFFPQLSVLFRVCIAAYRPIAFILGKIDPTGAWNGNYLVVSSVK